ncbi:MAG: gliding motility-associated C-terminal domain-containing protein [Saprospiraceae bacterium]
MNAFVQVKVMNGFSPNGDGHNDTVIDGANIYPENMLTIYNR